MAPRPQPVIPQPAKPTQTVAPTQTVKPAQSGAGNKD